MKSKFKTNLKAEILSDGRRRQLLSPLVFCWFYKYKSIDIEAPKDFITDFASVPRFMWWLFPPSTGKYVEPSVIHDYLYKNKIFSRKLCDKCFKEAMKINGTPGWKIFLIWLGVRIGGKRAYDK